MVLQSCLVRTVPCVRVRVARRAYVKHVVLLLRRTEQSWTISTMIKHVGAYLNELI